ncbi:hypothetical protein Sulku_1335 [Sulfuricurvum kujiense DSM 16994]|uniref:Uncharacterized protein n=1 Tax=Sulfuricurvum kujiense (strain ATCC BAA-921 / DSM 16994 / JCM 11577 / YK-1) TaxID=709032 RepID=E4TY78_SULKY|nr:hypothetical protein [Sulfuricurvum kujiense]ADR33998.1 hypothetical protein Sulku_1335 [Sulfuricurvum kujiense DSM 16994]
MPIALISYFVPLAVELIKAYVKTTDSSKDDKVLEVVQTGCAYLAPRGNNTVNFGTVSVVDSHKMIEAV